MTYYKICDVDELRDGEIKKVEIAGYEYLIARVEGRFFATDNFCTHEGGDLSRGHIEGNEVVCPLHAGRFKVETGEVASPPPDFPLETYPVKIEGGEVMMDIKF
jgi:3-phenylpropionate/trans-cinnamate dioxygenase ferredoxin subunit